MRSSQAHNSNKGPAVHIKTKAAIDCKRKNKRTRQRVYYIDVFFSPSKSSSSAKKKILADPGDGAEVLVALEFGFVLPGIVAALEGFLARLLWIEEFVEADDGHARWNVLGDDGL